MASTDPTGYLSIPFELTRGGTWKRPVRAASTGNLTLSGAQTIDGIACVAGDRVLAKDQSSGSQNGIYVVASGAWTRAFDMDQDLTTAVPAEEIAGSVVFVISGTVNARTIWYTTNVAGGTVGSTSIVWAQFTGGGASFATPAVALGTSAAAGAASTVIRSDSTIAAFDATSPTTQAFGDSAATGSAAFAARRDHKHGEPTAAVTTSGLTQATARLLGRTTASTGAIEEISVGTGLTLSAGSLAATGSGAGTLTTIEEVDGSPTDSAVTKLVLPNGTLSITSHVATYTPSGGGASFSSYETLITGMSGLVHRWKFEEASGNFADSVGSLTLTKSGTFTYAVAGGPVSGASGSVTLGASARGLSSGLGSLPVGNAARTIVTVYKGRANSSLNQWVYDYGTHSSRQAWAFIINSSSTNDRTGTIVWSDDLEMSSSGCNIETWHLHAAVYDGTRTTGLFFDGQYFGRTVGGVLNTATGGNFSLGQDVNGSGQTTTITLDDIAVFNRALEPYELAQLFNALVGALP